MPPLAPPQPPSVTPFASPRGSSLPSLLPLPPRPALPSTPTVRRLTPEELASRHEHGLCFLCDEKFHMGHRCAPRVHLLIADEDDPVETVGSNIDPHDPIPSLIDIPDPPTQISLNSFPGHVAPETLRLVGNIADNPILVLIDGGSTHNFIQE